MTKFQNPKPSRKFTNKALKNLKKRVLLLITSSTIVVAIAFGFSFYFAFISTGSAIAAHVPALSPIVTKLKSLLLVDTFALVAVITASLYIFNRLATTRLFSGLEIVQREMINISEGNLPARKTARPEGAFAEFESAFGIMLSSIKEKESFELKQLEECLRHIESNDRLKPENSIKELIKRKSEYLKDTGSKNEKAETDIQNETDEIFVQPS